MLDAVMMNTNVRMVIVFTNLKSVMELMTVTTILMNQLVIPMAAQPTRF